MKIIIDPYRGGTDTGKNYNGSYEKNILLNISKNMQEELTKRGIYSELVRSNDVSLTDDERNSIINEIKNNSDIIIQNRISKDDKFNIIYSVRRNAALASSISNNLESNRINNVRYFSRRLPTNTTLDFYSVIRNTTPNETIIIEYNNLNNYKKIINIIVSSIVNYLELATVYTIKKGDSLYKIAKKYNTTIDKIKRINNLTTNILCIGQNLKIPR